MTREAAAALPARYVGGDALALQWLDGVLAIGLNRPAKRNAIGVETTLALAATLRAAVADNALRAIVFHGVGQHFCAGMDMKDFFDHSDRSADELRRARAATDEWRARLLRRVACPVISAVRGYCLGGALPILECSDVVLAAPDAVFGMPEINFGFVPGGPIAKSLRGALPVRAASYAALTGKPFDARQAWRWGLVSQLVDGDVVAEALALAAAIARDADTLSSCRDEP
ncbi:enoyl-CoA hydratase/isomerase family protein [Bordetella sp. BOR01]|uniref:enoyl-CoA hydratase/isomerase family protein n=1 Tax=Bordetella sp. BOR01 TaxID=2854779 RepID=UPI001C45F119|nr:enoyl-CoA hydratase/isomerase family protein [Bordetella sp. BOR01]MBV7486840.1 enoyl-CoA hydratase/isomerase family protein [Bordetella sp. BOR01]